MSSNGKPFSTVKQEHWEQNWGSGRSTQKPLSLLNIFNFDATRLLRSKLIDGRSDHRIVEIGFVPGKFLHYFESTRGASCYGFDYSESGCRSAKKFLDGQGSKVQIFCQDVTRAPPNGLDAALVYSIGVVEHFEDPTKMIQAHLAAMADDGVCLIILPNYTNINFRVQNALDPENLELHNLESMTPSFWQKYSEAFPKHEFKTYLRGHLNPWMYSLSRFGKAGVAIQFAMNFFAFLMPSAFESWASMFVIEIRRRGETHQ